MIVGLAGAGAVAQQQSRFFSGDPTTWMSWKVGLIYRTWGVSFWTTKPPSRHGEMKRA